VICTARTYPGDGSSLIIFAAVGTKCEVREYVRRCVADPQLAGPVDTDLRQKRTIIVYEAIVSGGHPVQDRRTQRGVEGKANHIPRCELLRPCIRRNTGNRQVPAILTCILLPKAVALIIKTRDMVLIRNVLVYLHPNNMQIEKRAARPNVLHVVFHCVKRGVLNAYAKNVGRHRIDAGLRNDVVRKWIANWIAIWAGSGALRVIYRSENNRPAKSVGTNLRTRLWIAGKARIEELGKISSLERR